MFINIYISLALLLIFPPFVPPPFNLGSKNQRRTKERPNNSQTQKSTFIKIAVSFTSLIPCPILPREHRPTTERTPHQLPAYKKCFLLRFSEKVTQLSEKLNLPLGLYSEMEHTVYMRFIFTNLS